MHGPLACRPTRATRVDVAYLTRCRLRSERAPHGDGCSFCKQSPDWNLTLLHYRYRGAEVSKVRAANVRTGTHRAADPHTPLTPPACMRRLRRPALTPLAPTPIAECVLAAPSLVGADRYPDPKGRRGALCRLPSGARLPVRRRDQKPRVRALLQLSFALLLGEQSVSARLGEHLKLGAVVSNDLIRSRITRMQPWLEAEARAQRTPATSTPAPKQGGTRHARTLLLDLPARIL